MDYSYFKDPSGDWWWRLHAGDGSVVMDSREGYSSEPECVAAITRIKGSDNGSVLRQIDAPLPAIPQKTKEPPKETATDTTTDTTTDTMTDIATNKETEKTASSTVAAKAAGPIPDLMLGESPTAKVFFTRDNQLRWLYKENGGVVPYRLLGGVSEFDSIMAAIAVSVPKAYRRETYAHLGKALFATLHTPEGTKPGKEFRKVRLFVTKKAKEHARLAYILASLAAATALTLIVVPIYFLTSTEASALVALGGCFGAVGATISVLHRNPFLELDPWMSTRYHAIQGISRIVLGFIFGGIFVLASKANFVLGVIRENPYPLLVSCIVAGFSERLIPELLSKFESNHSSSTRAKNNSTDQESPE